MEVQIKHLEKNEFTLFSELVDIFAIVFEMRDFKKPSELHLKKCFEKEGFGAIVAIHNNKVIGGLTFYYLEQYYSTAPLAYIYDVAVLSAYQRQGIGKKLLQFINDYCKSHGYEEVYVQADKVDQHAIDFYRGTQPTQEDEVVQYSYILHN